MYAGGCGGVHFTLLCTLEVVESRLCLLEALGVLKVWKVMCV